MTRLLILATIILSIVSYASAQYVDTLNTPIGPVTQGAKVAVTWTLLPGAAPGTATGDLSGTDSATKNVVPIDPAVPLAPKSYLWEVKVPPGTYTLGLNDGAGLKQSGEVVVKAPAGPVPAPAPGDGKTAAPAPPTDAAPPAPAGGKTPAPAPAPADGGKAGTAPAPPVGTPSTPSTPAGGNAVSSPAPSAISTGSASSIFSGYDVVLSLLSVAIAMLQF